MFLLSGNGIGGPLPRSFMQSQWTLQKQIMARYRELGIVGHLPAFGGYAPWDLAVKFHQTKPGSGATRGICPNKDCDTAWIDGRDPLYTEVADAWMKQVIADFGSDHAWQMDAFCEPQTSTTYAVPSSSCLLTNIAIDSWKWDWLGC